MDVQQIFNYLVENYGIYAVFLLCMVEGDITLLLAGILAKTRSFGSFSYLQVLFFGTLGAVTGDFIGYLIGRYFQTTVNKFSYYRSAKPRIEMLTQKFGALSIFVSKYIYGIRAAWCIFYGVSGTPWWKFLLHDTISCFLWVLITSGVGYIFGSVVINLIGEFHNVGIVLLIVVVLGVIGFYLFERFYVSKKVEEVSPETVHKIEEAAHTTLHDISETIQEKLHIGANSNAATNNDERSAALPPPPPTTKARKAESGE
jgi:membrane protein DedA with SNARE-associated domain